jgi:hypothetical protein
VYTENKKGLFCSPVIFFRYSACIKRQAGYCCVQYQACAGVPNSFSLDSTPAIGLADTKCSMDYIGIPGKAPYIPLTFVSLGLKQ